MVLKLNKDIWDAITVQKCTERRADDTVASSSGDDSTTACYSDCYSNYMLKRTGTKHRIDDDRATNLSRLIMIGNLRIDLFVWWAREKCVVEKPVNPQCGLRVECVENRHDNIELTFYSVKV